MTFSTSYLCSDRLRLCQWLRAISQLRNDQHESLKMKHEYLTFLHVMLAGPYLKLAKPFDTMPPEQLVPLAECLGNRIADQYQELVPRVGPLQPMMCQKSEDGRAYLCVRRTPDNGILCYMCCAAEASGDTSEK